MTKVTIQRDLCLNLIVPLTAAHDFIPLPPFPPIPPPLPGLPYSLAACALELPVPAWWPPGGALGSHKFTSTVFHNGMQICLDGHDCGKFIPHLQILPAFNNLMTFIHIPFSSRKANFSSSTVLMNGKPTAGMTMIAWPPTPMTYCADPFGMPLADAPTSHFNTVEIHISLADWLAGAFTIVAGMVIDYVMFKRGGGTRKFGQDAGKDIAMSRAGKSAASLIASKIKSKVLVPFSKKWAAKQGVAVATGLARIGLTGQGSVSVTAPFGGGFGSLSGSLGKTDTGYNPGVTGGLLTGTGTVDGKGVTGTHRDPLGRGQETTSHQWGKGTTHTESSTDPFNGFESQTTTRGPDGTTTVTRSDGPTRTTLPNQL